MRVNAGVDAVSRAAHGMCKLKIPLEHSVNKNRDIDSMLHEAFV